MGTSGLSALPEITDYTQDKEGKCLGAESPNGFLWVGILEERGSPTDDPNGSVFNTAGLMLS